MQTRSLAELLCAALPRYIPPCLDELFTRRLCQPLIRLARVDDFLIGDTAT